jgi:hypothetical protein
MIHVLLVFFDGIIFNSSSSSCFVSVSYLLTETPNFPLCLMNSEKGTKLSGPKYEMGTLEEKAGVSYTSVQCSVSLLSVFIISTF